MTCYFCTFGRHRVPRYTGGILRSWHIIDCPYCVGGIKPEMGGEA